MIRSTTAMDTAVPPRRYPRRLLLAAAAGIALVGVLAAPYLSRWAKADRSLAADRVRLATVVRGDLERDISATGRVVAASFPRLFSPEPGIASVQVRAGVDVATGDLLVTVESPELAALVAQQRSTLATAEGELARARIAAKRGQLAADQGVALLEVRRKAAARELERMRQLGEEGLANRVELERARDELAIAELESSQAVANAGLEAEALVVDVRDRELAVERARLALDELERRLARLEIRSPFAGRIATVDVSDRDAVTAGQSLLTVVDLSRFEIELAIPESSADDVAPGTPAEVTWEGRAWPAEIATISPEVSGGQVAARLLFVGPAPTGLRQSQRLPTRIVLDRRVGVLKVARGPFLESGAGRRSYVVDGGLARAREIEVGATSLTEVEIVRGLVEGEVVVISDLAPFDGVETALLR